MKRYIRTSEDIFCMSNVRGKNVINPGKLKFSFYFSASNGNNHDIRVRLSFNADKLKQSMCGTLKLCDDWEYLPGPEDKSVNSQDIATMKTFFRRYLVLFCAVWDEQMQDAVLRDYFEGRETFQNVIHDLDFYENYSKQLDQVDDIVELEKFCRDNNLVNLHGN